MNKEHSYADNHTLRERIEAMPEDSILFRSDFPEYHTEYGHEALSDCSLYDAIVEHRRAYYALKHVNYELHNPSTINFTIPESSIEAWKADYTDMRHFFIYGESLSFDVLIKRIEELQTRVRNIK